VTAPIEDRSPEPDAGVSAYDSATLPSTDATTHRAGTAAPLAWLVMPAAAVQAVTPLPSPPAPPATEAAESV